MASRTIENYLKQLYLEQQNSPKAAGGGTATVPMGKLASLMAVVPGTATAMVKTLADAKLVHYSPRTGVKLTPAGTQLALHVLRRHRLVELFLVKNLGLDWSEVHEEAEELEHVISDKVLARIDDLLGHPTTDPHGDPIPTAAGHLDAATLDSLATCPLKREVQITRILDQTPAFLQFALERQLIPGAKLQILDRNPQSDAVHLHSKSGDDLTLSTLAAAKFLVKKSR